MTQGQGDAVPQSANADGQVQAQPPESQPQQQPQETAEEFLARTGFKSLADAEKSYKEAQAKITKVSQEKAQLEQALQGMSSQSHQPPPQSSRSGQGVDFFDDPETSVMRIAEQVATRRVNETIQQLEARQAIERVRAEDQAKFDRLRPYMQNVYQNKPFLNNLGEAGLRQAMEEAAAIRSSELESLRAELLGDGTSQNNQDIKSQAKQEVLDEMNRNRQATIPQGGVSRPISDDSNKRRQELISSGDLDALLDEKFSAVTNRPTSGGRPI